MWKRLVVAAVLALVVAVPAARADDPLWCSGTIDGVIVNGDGSVYVNPSWRGDWLLICSLDNAWKNISPKTCSVWVSEAMTAHTTRKKTTMRYDGTTYTCPTVPSYGNAPTLGYLMLEKQ